MKRLFLPVMLMLAACAGENNDETVGKDIADDYREVLDEAAEVEQKLQDSKEQIDAALRDAEDDGDR